MLKIVSSRSHNHPGCKAPARVNSENPANYAPHGRPWRFGYGYPVYDGDTPSDPTPPFQFAAQPAEVEQPPLLIAPKTGRTRSPLAVAFLQVLKAPGRWWFERRAAESLYALDDALLKDIGISRGEIEFVVRSSAERPKRV